MKVLLAVDGSEYSDAAITEVAARSWPAGTEIKVVNAFEIPMVPTPEVWIVQAEYYDQMEKATREQAKQIVDAAATRLSASLKAFVVLSKEILRGPAKLIIVEHADKWRADLIVVGSHGYGPWHRFLLGSVSQAVVSHAKCSVEVARKRQPAEQVKAA